MRFFSIGDIDELDFNKLVRQLPGGSWNPFSVRGQYVTAILQSYPILQQYEINTPMRLAHFIGQGLVETGCLGYRVENLNYSAQRLRAIFPGYFRTDEIAREYERQPEKIANRVYSNRLGNGAPESGEGWRYRGRGFFQLTGKDNYRNYGAVAGIDLVNDPEIIERDLKKSVQVAAAYFHHVGLGPYADRNDICAVSRGVNRGDPTESRPAHSEADRVLWTNRALDLVRDPQALLARATSDGVLRSGATGEAVRSLQRSLTELGYAVGTIDGVFGPATRRAVLAFQDEHRLPTTGAVDEATRTAIATALGGPTESPPPAPAPAPQPEAPPAPAPEAPVAHEEPVVVTPPVVEPPPVAEPAPAPAPTPEVVAEPPAPEVVAEPPTPAPTPEIVSEAPLAPAQEASEAPPASDGEPSPPGAAPNATQTPPP